MQQPANGIDVGAALPWSRGSFVAAFPVQQQGFDDLSAVWIGNGLQRCKSTQGRNLLVDPGLDLLLYLSFKLSSRFGIEKGIFCF